MGTRFSRRAADGTVEHYDDKEALEAAQKKERSGWYGFFGLLIGGVLTYYALSRFGADWPKWLRFGLVVVGSGGMAYVLTKLGDVILFLFFAFVMLCILFGIGAAIWESM
ncbi:hypothetical protein D5039_14150 [Verminephrobacter aporrectodeae subsp. tuberculatae]|uniref:Uncharacterized protein n=1 Tax=Verminephrobacter aporrectodeae subsp. tuberculatae TaxID=1110392 RepID=A0ABT3KV83_9BURK|nr:hypothetical protein [Verminephrobacter aporrectodeae]MCW5322251.1 hypothetical protein [Verminephrobacter aporrectodeae subsp. tuberculatae]MCW8166150.1 hypothetical protein [Verminephrobacter aporrectodeae subsp. tuberculatae]MCW8170134.1 hypothetical protein [Verminephrobacter aporrectodeae subsp. tuberculatae]